MEDETSFNRSAFATPSVDPLDAALQKLEADMAAGPRAAAPKATGQEPEKDEETVRNTTAGDVPEDDDFEDDEDTVAANTPAVTDDDDDDDSPESLQTDKSAKASTPDANKRQTKGTDSDDDSQLSRKKRGKLIEELRQELEREQKAKADLEDSLRASREEDERLNKEVDRALGTQAEYDKATEDGLSGDKASAEKARIWKANRDFFKKLTGKAQRDTSAEFMASYWNEVSGLPGVTQDALKAPNLSAILKNIYDAGVSSVKESSSEEVDKLKADVETWRGRYRSLKAKAGGNKTSPLGGGGSTATEMPVDWKKKYIDPSTGLFTDEADAIVAQFGIAALADPKLRKR